MMAICLAVLGGTRRACGWGERDGAPQVGVHQWINLPSSSQCPGCIARVHDETWRRHYMLDARPRWSASRDIVLAMAGFCGGLWGAWDATLEGLLAQWRDGEPPPEPLLDEMERRGFLDGSGVWPTRERDWVHADKHGTGDNPHVWLPWMSGGSLRRDSSASIRDWSNLRRCACGMFEHENERPSPDFLGDIPDQCTEPGCTREDGHPGQCGSIVPEWDACSACGRARAPTSRRHCGAAACIARVGDDCHDRACQREAGHEPPHMSRSAIHGYSGIEEHIEEWADEERLQREREAADVNEAGITQRYLDGDPDVHF